MVPPVALRSYYARVIAGKAGSKDQRLIDAFAVVERERFVGPGPWKVNSFANGYVDTPSDDPAYLYQDVVVALVPERGLNNGEPQLHARCLAALQIKGGETAVHVGSGTGYYTAILAQLVGQTGTVIAYEIDPDLAAKAATNLTPWPNVSVKAQSATATILPPCDIVYVSAGATRPPDAWLDALAPGGRLLFLLTPNVGLGGMLLVTRVTENSFDARFVLPATAAKGTSSLKPSNLANGLRSNPCAETSRPTTRAGMPARDGGYRLAPIRLSRDACRNGQAYSGRA